MADDPGLVDTFLTEVEGILLPIVESGGDRLSGRHRLVSKYRHEAAAWREGKVPHVRGIAEAVNELCIARRILEDLSVARAEYEPALTGTAKTIDFLVHPNIGEPARLFYDVKTVHPEAGDGWALYERATAQGWLRGLNLDPGFMGPEIAHEKFAARARFVEHTVALEAKIRGMADRDGCYFRMVFCGDGFQWHRDELEDFADTYDTGRSAWDHLAAMQEHYLAENGWALERSIHGFCLMRRPTPAVQELEFAHDVRGPSSVM